MVFRKRIARKVRTTRKPRKSRSTASAIAHSLTKLQKLEVKKLVRGPNETKYNSAFLCTPDYRGGVVGFVLNQLAPTLLTPPQVGTNFHPYINSTSQIFSAIPQISQGIDSFQRIGDKLSPTRGRVDMTFVVDNTPDAYAYDLTVHVWMLTAVSVKALDDFGSIPITELLDGGQGTMTYFSGSQVSEQLVVNRNQFHVLHHKKFRLAKVDGVIGPQGSPRGGAVTSGIGFQTNMHRLSLNVPVVKTLKYDSNSAVYPTNYAPFIVVGYSTNDSSGSGVSSPGSAYDNGHTVMCCARAHLWYKDS